MRDEAIFATCPDEEFFGREDEIGRVLVRASGPRTAPLGGYLVGARWTGKTELLRRVYHRLFWGQERVVPVYYQFRGCLSAADFAGDFLRAAIKQYLAFSTRSPLMIKEELTLKGLKRALEEGDMEDLAGLIERHARAHAEEDHVALFRNAVSSPSFIARRGRAVFLLLDDLDAACGISLYKGGPGMLGEYLDALISGQTSYLAAGVTAKALEGSRSPLEVMELKGLGEAAALSMMMKLCNIHGVEFDSEILANACLKLEGVPVYIKNMVWSAARTKSPITTLREFVELYAACLLQGNIGALLRSAMPAGGKDALRVLFACANSPSGVSEEELRERFSLGAEEVKEAVEALRSSGFVDNGGLGVVKWAGDGVAKDFIDCAYAVEVRGKSAEEAKTELMLRRLKEGFRMQGARVGGGLTAEVGELMRGFDGQRIPKSFFKNLMPSHAAAGREDEISLPHIVGSFQPAVLDGDASKDRGGPSRTAGGPQSCALVVAHGFQSARYDEKNEVMWIAGVKESPVPMNAGDVEDFMKRSNLLMDRHRVALCARWLVAREGFTGEAAKRMDDTGVWATDASALGFLRDTVAGGAARPTASKIGGTVKEFEITLPMKARSELVAAKTAGEIGEEMGFDDDGVTGIKTAVVEACINAFEHSKVRNGRVHLRFVVGGAGLAIYIQNSGRVFDRLDSPQTPAAPAAGSMRRRGWGMEMMQGLMDVVRLENLRGGTRLVMVKYLKKDGDKSNG
ncbi:MAG: ATP-binding protein [Deltaproteobacteria bacterium]|nr:ATP-binding protein [Deltaproteobacteria bacterium]